ncbi:MAG: 30S ribosomal protein S18 [Planctomycetota bacterium]|nr:MAG: 30S ribosomal protein S18 [Planctomycetota bacterium]
MAPPVKRRRRKLPPKEVVCPFDAATLDKSLDYKWVGFISKFRSTQGKLISRKRTGLNKQHQKQLIVAIKRARFMGLLGYVGS